MDPSTFVRPDLVDVVYHGVPGMDAISAEVGIPVDELIKLNANENAYGTAQEVKDAITARLGDLFVYPDPAQELIRNKVATLHGSDVTADNICCGAGSDDILDIIIRMTEPSKVIISTPTFGMYKFLSGLAKSTVINVERTADFEVDIPAVLASLQENPHSVLFLPSPNNPTGNVLSEEDVRLLCKENSVIVIDEAYIDFTDDGIASFDRLVGEFPNLIVCRTFSKWAGLAGARFGYCVADQRFVNVMLAIKQPYNVNIPAEAGAIAAIEHRESIMKTVLALRSERDVMYSVLGEFSWLRPCPSQANFVLCEVYGCKADDLALWLRKRGIIIRYFGSQGGNLNNYIRISSGKPEQTARVVSALKEIEAEKLSFAAAMESCGPLQAVMFDMDGVLVDVSKSYRAAIIDTAKHFGATVTGDDVTAAKAAGNANNDWILTHRLISNSPDVTDAPSLEEVTEKFEALYQGTPGSAGLRDTESLAVDKELLVKLAKKYPLAIVTGRPVGDANYFLDQYGIKDLFKAMVCMRDAPAKPDPAPVLLAMERLGLADGPFILVGDTPDDLRAALAAGNVVPIGAVPPGVPDGGVVQEARVLMATGAATVLQPGLEQLRRLL